MKKLLFIAMLMITITGYSQIRTSEDVIGDLNKIICSNNIIKVDTTITNLMHEYTLLKTEEIRNTAVPMQLTYVLPTKFCWTCRCSACGCFVNAGNGSCSLFPGGCNGQCCCGLNQFELYVMSCDGGMCGNIQGFAELKK